MINHIESYVCSAGHETITIQRADGTIPFSIVCRTVGCHAPAKSGRYIPNTQNSRFPDWEWYRPLGRDLWVLEPHVVDYVERGGLVLRKIERRHRESPAPRAEW